MNTSPIPVNGGQRRSPRITVLIQIMVEGQDLQKRVFSETATATNLNLHGAAIQLNRQLLVGSVITITNRNGIKHANQLLGCKFFMHRSRVSSLLDFDEPFRV